MQEFLTINDLSEYLQINRATLYAKVSRKELPFYKIGHLVRFKRTDIDTWLESLRETSIDTVEKARKIIKSSNINIDHLIKKAIESEKTHEYNSFQGKQASKEGR